MFTPRSRDGVNKTKNSGTVDGENAIPDPLYLRRYEHFPDYYRYRYQHFTLDTDNNTLL